MCSVEWVNVTILSKCFIINDLQFDIHKLKLFKSGGMFHDIPPNFLFFWTNLTACGPAHYENNFLTLQ